MYDAKFVKHDATFVKFDEEFQILHRKSDVFDRTLLKHELTVKVLYQPGVEYDATYEKFDRTLLKHDEKFVKHDATLAKFDATLLKFDATFALNMRF